ncbi:MAG: hypothetical protein ACD_46C00517G0002 [uncultured bacterium]|nr:MAG: hypothetical protein ACD_46C00517G0002 [uncultured bacterium]
MVDARPEWLSAMNYNVRFILCDDRKRIAIPQNFQPLSMIDSLNDHENLCGTQFILFNNAVTAWRI